ncbi:imidazolonepropionase-like amidohydrolase [Clostridium punense]|uniref:Imidazolonepropionase-like amidohydrolase n=1 Tax=Clostridium punense TaxID=1054297 RepID=A0ABS4JZB4_9CLOT|nr:MULTISPECIES: amidohydrolase [Clostridium]EQB88807.1 amidohydrolase [Clostridium sp. BL8]MBP2020864.1 imidazolonepropionase-like amidohydrolase [Clostridium punense]
MLIIKNANIHTMAKENFDNGVVAIEDGKILLVGKDLNIPEDAQVIDAQGGFLMPGMIDAHCHVGMWENAMGFEGADGNEAVDPVTPQLRAIDAINPVDKCFKEALEAGITTVATGPGSANVIGGTFVTMKTHGRRVDDMVIDPYTAMKVAFGENPKRVYNSQKKSPSTRMATAAILREYLMKAKMYVEKQEKALENNEKAPDFDMKMEALSKVIKREIPLKAHAHRADDILTALRISKEFNIEISLEHCTEGHLIADFLKEESPKAIIVGPTLSDRSKIELQNLTFETPSILNKAGLKVAIMTDHPVIPLQYLPICAALASREGMEEEEALRSITINAAEALNVAHRVGSIETGKDADIVIYSGHPFDLRNKVKFVMINGEIVKNQF